MGPEKNPKLFEALAADKVDELSEEFVRRNLLATTLKLLSEVFDEKDHTSHPVIEPTLLGRMVGLSKVQRTHMGVAGFDPMEYVDFDGTLEAQSAPHHDEYETENGSPVRTRVIKLSMPDGQDSEVEVFGLNVYHPDINTDEQFGLDDHSKSLVIVGEQGSIKDKVRPITGHTVAFAVRHKRTDDAKLYRVDVADDEADNFMRQGIQHTAEGKTIVVLPDQKVVTVQLLPIELQEEMLRELEASISQLQRLEQSELSDQERLAVSELRPEF